MKLSYTVGDIAGKVSHTESVVVEDLFEEEDVHRYFQYFRRIMNPTGEKIDSSNVTPIGGNGDD